MSSFFYPQVPGSACDFEDLFSEGEGGRHSVAAAGQDDPSVCGRLQQHLGKLRVDRVGRAPPPDDLKVRSIDHAAQMGEDLLVNRRVRGLRRRPGGMVGVANDEPGLVVLGGKDGDAETLQVAMLFKNPLFHRGVGRAVLECLVAFVGEAVGDHRAKLPGRWLCRRFHHLEAAAEGSAFPEGFREERLEIRSAADQHPVGMESAACCFDQWGLYVVDLGFKMKARVEALPEEGDEAGKSLPGSDEGLAPAV